MFIVSLKKKMKYNIQQTSNLRFRISHTLSMNIIKIPEHFAQGQKM